MAMHVKYTNRLNSYLQLFVTWCSDSSVGAMLLVYVRLSYLYTFQALPDDSKSQLVELLSVKSRVNLMALESVSYDEGGLSLQLKRRLEKNEGRLLLFQLNEAYDGLSRQQ